MNCLLKFASPAVFLMLVAGFATTRQSTPSQTPAISAQGAFFALVVIDMNASLRWYQSELGLRLVKQGKSPRVAAETAVLAGQNIFVELIRFNDRTLPKRVITDSAPVAGPMKTGAILEPAKFDALASRLESHGLEARIFKDKEMGERSFIVRDNDGNLIQFFAKDD